VIGGGQSNNTLYAHAAIGGGANNSAGNRATVGGGYYNHAVGGSSTIAGGESNYVSGTFATIGGGSNNSVGAEYATVPGGYYNNAAGETSFAAGHSAQATHTRSFVWGGAPNGTYSWGDQTFTVRAPGGVRFYTWPLFESIGVELPAGGGAWANLCDVNQKRLHGEVNTADVLQKVSSLPLHRWSYKTQDESIHHIGPTAQDFYAAFELGDNNTTISTLDPDGVALAAIQELAKRNSELEKQVAQLQAQMQSLMTNTPVSAR
jgi:hypothetical protein